MASSLAIKRRIKSVKSIAQVTKTMQVIAASRVKKVQESAIKLKPYSVGIENILNIISKQYDLSEDIFFNKCAGDNLVILISPNRGQAGGLPSSIINKTFKWLLENNEVKNSFICINKKGFKALKKQSIDVLSFYDNLNYKTDLINIDPIVADIVSKYSTQEYANVFIIYSRFINLIKQDVLVEQLLPITYKNQFDEQNDEYLIEPDAKDILKDLIPHYIEMKIFDAIVNNSASEESARMIAMKNATDNAKDMISDLVLSYNKERQLKITQQVAEISAAL